MKDDTAALVEAPKKEVTLEIPLGVTDVKVKVKRQKVVKKVTKKPAAKKAPSKKQDVPEAKLIGNWKRKFKFKKPADQALGQCDILGCKREAAKERGRRCLQHLEAVRKVQLADNNKVWMARKKKGLAGHHVVYKREGAKASALTGWALEQSDAALEVVRGGHSIVKTVKDFEAAKRLAKQLIEKAKSKKTKKPKKETVKDVD
jgi:hypothetical protein